MKELCTSCKHGDIVIIKLISLLKFVKIIKLYSFSCKAWRITCLWPYKFYTCPTYIKEKKNFRQCKKIAIQKMLSNSVSLEELVQRIKED